MRGRLIELNKEEKKGRVYTGNDGKKELTIYFPDVPGELQIDCTVEFEVVTSRWGNRYAKFLSVVERNATVFNTEDRVKWYTWGENEENDFVSKIVPQIGLELKINSEKKYCPWAIDLYDYTNNRPADLKTQNTPFFTAGRYTYGNKPYDPTYTVTFNRKDYENYIVNYPECDIYFWIAWTQREYKNIRVGELRGVWRAPFWKMAEKIQNGEVTLHKYQNRINDDHNARESYLFDLRDNNVFERLI